MREAWVGVVQDYREVLVRLVDGVIDDGDADVPGCLEAELAPHVCAREVALAEAEAAGQSPIVRALGGGAVGRSRGQGDVETALRNSVRRGGGPGLQGDRSRMLVDAHERLVPADGDGYEIVVGDLYAHNGWSALQVRRTGICVLNGYREVLLVFVGCVILNGHLYLLYGAIAAFAVDGYPAEVVPAESDGIVHLRIVAGLGRAAVRRTDGGVEGEPVLRSLVLSGDGVGTKCGAAGVLTNRYVRLFPAESNWNVFVVLDCDDCRRRSSLEMREAGSRVGQPYPEGLVRFIRCVVYDGYGEIPGCSVSLLAVHVGLAEVARDKGRGRGRSRVVVALGRAAIGGG